MKTKKPRRKKPIYRTPREVYNKWIDALNSGRYEQGQHCLRYKDAKQVDRYCCLGVLCDLMRKDGGPTWGVFTDAEGHKIFDMLGENEFLPSKIAKYLKLSRNDVDKLIDYNDKHGYSFREIASFVSTIRDQKFP